MILKINQLNIRKKKICSKNKLKGSFIPSNSLLVTLSFLQSFLFISGSQTVVYANHEVRKTWLNGKKVNREYLKQLLLVRSKVVIKK